jgi:hypothetical protein
MQTSGRTPGRRRVVSAMQLVWRFPTAIVGLPQQPWRGSTDAGQAGNTGPPTGIPQITPKITSRIIDREPFMRFLSYAYRISSNFVFLALVYYSLNFLEKYQQRAIVAILVLIYAAMRAASALRSFYFFQRIERLELEARRLATLTGDGPAASAARKQIVNDVATLRHGGEMKSYIDLLFLTLIVVLCISKIVTN